MAERPRRPEWMKVRAPSANSRYFEVKGLMREGGLHTICEEARCPNIGECWGRGTATFQILGDTCTRACRYCYVHSGKPDGPPDPLEPLRLAQAAAQMKLSHVVVTSVDRDDLPDRGAGHYAATIRAIKRKLPAAKVEILTPDFLDVEEDALATVLAARPEVFNHNIETVRRLHPHMRGAKASYDKALWLLERAKEVADYPVLTKSGIIVGLGETNDEVVETMRDLRGTRRRRRDDRPVPAAVDRSTRRSTAGSTRTSSAGSASRASTRASAPSSPGRSSARRTARTSSGTRPRPAAAPSPTRRKPAPLPVRLGHRVEVERLVEDRLVHAGLARDLAQRAARRRRLLHDLRRLVVADERVERGRRRERALGVLLVPLAVRLDPVDALLGEEPSTRSREARSSRAGSGP